MAQPFLHAGQDALVGPSFGIDDPVRMQSGLRQGRGEQIPVADAPQNWPMRPGQDSGGKQGRCRSVQGAIAAARDLMERAQGQAASRQPVIDFRFPERQNTPGNPVAGFNPAEFLPKSVYLGWVCRHRWIQWPAWGYVPLSFFLPARVNGEIGSLGRGQQLSPRNRWSPRGDFFWS